MTGSISSDIKKLGNGIGTYFRQVASYEKRKKTADISYLHSAIKKYKNAFDKATLKLTDNNIMWKILLVYYIGALSELKADIAKVVLHIAMAGNPFKWIFDSGNVDEIIDSIEAVAESARKLTETITNTVAYDSLKKFNDKISKKLLKNKGPLEAVRKLLKEFENNSTSTEFSKLQDEFISKYSDYTPAIRKDELKELTVHWLNLIDAICNGVENTDGLYANIARSAGDTNGKCLDAKRSAAMLTVCLEEIYDFQFELMETMASLMHSFVQIESSKALMSSSQDKLSTVDFRMIEEIIGISYKMTQANNVEMLCNIMEYQNGGKLPSVCKGGLSTYMYIDKLTSTERPNYNIEKHYVEVPTQRSITVNDALAWFDLAKLYAGEKIEFQVPNRKWLVKQGWLSEHSKDKVLYVKEFYIILPVVSTGQPKIKVTVTPSDVGNRLQDNSDIYYSITNAHTMAYSYIEGHGQKSCFIEPKIDNPYKMPNCSKDSDYPKLCQTSRGTTAQIKEYLYPSIYSKFGIRITGYKKSKLDVPASKMNVYIGLTYFYLPETERRKRTTIMKKRIKRHDESSPSEVYCRDNSYNPDSKTCEACPSGTKSYYDGLFCGDLIRLVEANVTKTPTNETFTYELAVDRCNEVGSIHIAHSTRIQEAVNLGAKSCTCGWIEGAKVVSVGGRSDCKDTSDCTTGKNIRHVYCCTRFKP